MREKIALFSVNELKDIVEFARILVAKGWVIVATEFPYKLLRQKKVSVTPVEVFVGITKRYKFPATLHPKMEAALTEDNFEQRIEIVYDIPYGPDGSLDVGGNALLALAVKGRRIPITSHSAMKSAVEAISKFGDIPSDMRDGLINEAIQKISNYYNRAAEYISKEKIKYLKLVRCYELINGENPYQIAALWRLGNQDKDALALPNYRLITEIKPCFTNLADLDAITEAMVKLASAFQIQYKKQPYITIAAKHGNACGIGVDWGSKDISMEKALWANPLAIWGGEVIVNFNLGREEAYLLVASEKRNEIFGKANWMLDVIAAPEIDNRSYSILAARKNTKVFVNKSLLSPGFSNRVWSYRFTRGGVIMQSIADYCLDISKLTWTIPESLPCDFDDILIAWAAAFNSFHGGNEVALSRKRQLLTCAGGPSTVDAAETAINRGIKLHQNLSGVSFAANAFFPFTDAPSILVNSKVVAGVVPAGGINHSKVLNFFKEKNINVGFIPEEFRGFYRH